jgi:hypothetical protein
VTADGRDPKFQGYNDRLYPVDDPPVCERTGCGHLIGRHSYSPTTDLHGPCAACACPVPLSPWSRP